MRRAPRVLVVAYYFPPIGGGGVTRTLALVRALADRGSPPIVLTVDDAAWARDASLVHRVPSNVRVLRVPNPDWGRVTARATPGAPQARAGGGRLRRWLVPDLHVAWSALALPLVGALAATRRVDVVYTSSPPYSANAAGVLARAFGVPWAADFRDGWTCCPTRADLGAWRGAVERRLEEAVLRRADRVFFTSEAVRARYARRVAGLARRSETIPTGFDPAECEAARSVEPPRGRLEIVHAGGVQVARREPTLARWLEALRAWLRRDPTVRCDVRVRLLGAEPGVRAAVGAAALGDLVQVEPAVPRSRLYAALRGAHLALLLAPAGPRAGEPIPGKLFDAVGADRRVLALTPEGPLARLIRETDLGFVCDPADRDGIVAALTSLRARVLRDGALAPPAPAGRAALAAPVTIPRLVRHLEELAGVPGGERCPSPSAW